MDPRFKTFLVTGVSSGLGRVIAEYVLANGHRVVGILRQAEQIDDFEALAPGRAFGRLLDESDEAAIEPTIAAIEVEVAPIDVLIINAGYGHEGTFEESTVAQLRAQFEGNVFGTVAVVMAVLSGMRERRRGHIFVVSSMGRLVELPGLSFYHGSKFALEGIFGALAQEVTGFGVYVTAVEPGPFDRDWANGSVVRARRSIPDYDALRDSIRASRHVSSDKKSDNLTGVAREIMQALKSVNPPVHLVLGSGGLHPTGRVPEALRRAREALREEVAERVRGSQVDRLPERG